MLDPRTALGLLDSRIAGLLEPRTAGFSHCWTPGLLDCLILGLLDSSTSGFSLGLGCLTGSVGSHNKDFLIVESHNKHIWSGKLMRVFLIVLFFCHFFSSSSKHKSCWGQGKGNNIKKRSKKLIPRGMQINDFHCVLNSF